MQNKEAKDVIIRNNISSNHIYQILAESGVDLSELTVDHNLTEGDRGFPDIIFVNSFEGNPCFVDQENRNFHLGSNAEAIDKGSSDLAPNFDDNRRPNGTEFDTGAYEYY